MAQAADSITRGLKAWLEACFAEAEVLIDSASAGSDAGVIRLGLVSVGVDPSSRRATALMLTYRITVEAADPLVRHRLISEIAFALTDHPILSLGEGTSVPLEMKPPERDDLLGLTLTARLLRDRVGAASPPVLQPLVVKMSELGELDGSVATVDGVPVAGALVEIPSLDLRQTSRTDGSFQFSGLPARSGPFTVVARKSLAETKANARPGERLALILTTEA